MEEKKRVTILVIIALILATTAITMNIIDSKNAMSSNLPATIGWGEGIGRVGVEVIQSAVEDKAGENNLE